MDATLSFREFLRETGIHEYALQGQGPANKVNVPAYFVLPDQCISSTTSLYRPVTKKGDPRIWFTKLTRYCKPTDLLAVIAHSGELYVFNMSNEDVVRAFSIPGSCPYEVFSKCSEVISPVAFELLGKLKAIHAQGYIAGMGYGDTDVGFTLESLLGIARNSSKAPDYKGIELKSSRHHGKVLGHKMSNKGNVTLFTETPDWKRSKFDALGILNRFGYIEGGRRQLYCTVSNVPNSRGLYLDASDEVDLVNKAKTDDYTGDVAVWALETLKDRLAEKHHETFWVQASSEFYDGKEFYQYDFVRHTRRPNTANLGSMFDAGIITLNYTMHIKPNGKVRDHGYSFRMLKSKLSHIFPLERVYDLSK